MTGLQATEKGLNVWANNLVNANTTAFAPATPLFAELPLTPSPQGQWPGLSRITPNALTVGNGAQLAATPETFGLGSLVQTGNPTDLAIQGPGFFVVQTPAGPAYTRDGSFSVDGKGTLVTAQGYPVLSSTGTSISVGTGAVSIGANGVVTSGGKSVGTIAVANFPNPGGLIATQQNLFVQAPAAQDNAGPPSVGAPSGGTRLVAGALEGSGADVATGLVNLINLERSFQLDAHAASQASQMLSWAATLGA